jgi:predicted permease
MTTNEFVEMQMVILVASCALMLAVFSVESGGLAMRIIIFAAAFINAIAAIIFIKRERKRLHGKEVKDISETEPR